MQRMRRIPIGLGLAGLALVLLGTHVEEGDTLQDLDPGEAGFLAHAPPSKAALHAQAIAVAETYLFHGLVAHDGDAVLLADACRRTEQGRSTGDNAAAIRASLEPAPLQVITRIANLR